MLVGRIGAGRRLIGELVWEPGIDAVDVNDPQMLQVLLLAPDEDFFIDGDEPMLQLPGMTADRLGALALEGVCGQSDLMGLPEERVSELAQAANVQTGVIVDWALHGSWLEQEAATLEEV